MADALSLLFELTADGRPAVSEFQRVRKAFASEIAALRKSVVQSFTLPPIKLPTVPTASGRGQADTHVKEFRRIEAEAKKSAKAQETEQRRLNRAVESLQRQRSAAIIASFKAEEHASIASARAQERAAQQAARSISNAFRGIGPGLQSIGRTLTVGITVPLLALGAASLKSAKDLDANVNTLKAFTGSAEAAERRLAQLIKTSRDTPGLTTNLSLTLDAQLRVAQTTQETIDRVLPAIGRLNAVSKLPDAARFTQNLLQLVTQNFERQDLKELVGQSPLAGQLLTQIFNVDSPTNAKAIRESAQRLGLTTVDAFFQAFAEAAQRNQGLATVTESIGTRFEKVVDRVTVALRPLGLAIINAIEPFIEPVSRLIERLGEAFTSLSPPVKTAIIVIAGIAAAAGPVLFILGGLATAIADVVTAVGTIASAVAAVGLPVIAAAIGALIIVIGRFVAILGVLGLAWQTNFLNIQGLVLEAASAVLDAFNRIRAVIEEATQRILPTLQSITARVLGVIAALWERYGSTIVRVISTTFEITVRTLEAFAGFFGNAIDLVAKLIDGDWRGAWRAFSRIVINALDGLTDFFTKALRILTQGFRSMIAFILRQAIAFVDAGTELALKLVVALAAGIVAGAPQITDALTKMLLIAAAGIAFGQVGQVIAAGTLAAMRKAAAEGVTVPVKAAVQQENLQRIRLNPDGSVKTDTKPPPGSPTGTDKGADTETRRRIRLLELEAEKVRTLTDAQLAQEQIAFDERRKSLEDYTNAQIEAAGDVMLAQLKIYEKEREEAEKIRNKSARDLALGEIAQKEFEAEQAFSTKVAQLEAARRKAEFDAEREHRQAILELNEQADAAELARLEDLQRRGALTAFDVASRQAEIEKAARARHREELEIQLREADQNKEDRKKILDELQKFDEESAESVRRNERLKREAAQETADAYRDYKLAILDALEATSASLREVSVSALEGVISRVTLGRREQIKQLFQVEREGVEAEHRERLRAIEQQERDLTEKARRAGELEAKQLEILNTTHDRTLAEIARFNEEKSRLNERQQEEEERANPFSARNLFGDRFADISYVFGPVAAAIDSIKQHAIEAFLEMGQAFGAMVEQWVLTGKLGAGGVRNFVASALASLAKMFTIQALAELAYGIAALTPWGAAIYGPAPQHFKAAALLGAAAAAAGIAGRGIAGNTNDNSRTASAAVNGGEPTPRNRDFQNGPPAVESSSSANREGSSGGFFGRLVARIEAVQQQSLEMQRQQMLVQGQTAQALTRIQAMRHGDALAIGAAENPAAVGRAVIDHSNSAGDFNEALQRNLGFA